MISYAGLAIVYEKKYLYDDAIAVYRKLIDNATMPQDKVWVEKAQNKIREFGGTL